MATPISRRAVMRGRIAVGSLAAAGAFALLANGNAAEAKTLTPTGSVTQTPIQPTPVNKYVVVEGDTLYDIAAQAGVSLDALVTANGLSTEKPIQIGQHLVIPTAKTSMPSEHVSTMGVIPTDLPTDSTRFALKSTFKSVASKYGVPLSLLEAVAWNESGWQNQVVSRTGAVGIGQLEPSTVAYVNQYLVSEPLDPSTESGNISISASYLHYLIDQNNGDYRAALAAYYQGSASLKQHGAYSDTKSYVANVLALQSRYF